jgi:hypothetical protein
MPLKLFPFRYRDPLTGKWVNARYVAERHEIARYKDWEIAGLPEIRGDGQQNYFRPYPPTSAPSAANVEPQPVLRGDERFLVLLFLRRYVTWCARRRRFEQMLEAATLFRQVRQS